MDLHTIASEEQQLRGERRAACTRRDNAKASHDAAVADIARIDGRLADLEAAAVAVFQRTRLVGDAQFAEQAEPLEPASIFGEPETVAAE